MVIDAKNDIAEANADGSATVLESFKVGVYVDNWDAQILGTDGEAIPGEAVIRTTVGEAVGVNEPFRITAAYANTGTAPVPDVVKLFLDNAD